VVEGKIVPAVILPHEAE